VNLLVFEFSSPQRSVAVLAQRGGGSGQEWFEQIESGSGGMQPLKAVEEVLRQAHLEREQIEGVAVGLGPGSYTGIRAALALAQGWQLARGVRLMGVSSADSIAAEAFDEGLRGPVAVLIDAQRNELYCGDYELNDSGWRLTQALRVVSAAGVLAAQNNGRLLIGPEVTRWFPDGKKISPRAVAAGKLALAGTSSVAGEKLEPIYLRPAQFVKAPPPRVA
jgi:tRNA threonylcarbamoyladenosine biosynthesis protein TsaB